MDREQMIKITVDVIKEFSKKAGEFMAKSDEVNCDIQLAKAEAVKDIAIKLGLNA